jgi:molybdopterin adenylyltransferase
VRAALITVSTSKAAGTGEDQSGPKLQELALALGAEVAGRELIPDDRETIERRLRHWSDEQGCALVLTSGGTGLSVDDVTPEATRAVIDREIPGIAEAMRLLSRPHTPNWMLARPVAGVRGATLIVNLPGSPRAIEQVAHELAPGLAHALALIAGRDPHSG